MKNIPVKPADFHILLVDDREENLISLEEMLEAPNRHFTKVTSGNDALRTVLRNKQIGLILLDVQMPGMDGFEVARLLQANPQTRDISIIFVTAINKGEQNVLKGFEEGAVDFLEKPLDINITRAKVNVFEKLYFYQHGLKDAIAERERVNQQLERFMHVVAHDLKSPLNGAISFLHLIRDEDATKSIPDLADNMDIAIDSISRLSGMITAILDYSRQTIANQQTEEVDTHLMVEELIRALFPPPHIMVTIDGRLPVLHTCKPKLLQVFQNLLSNAIKYMNKAEGRITVGYSIQPEFYEFWVRDNGPGIARKDTERIFRLFEILDAENTDAESTGVGLNILKLLVEEQGGQIRVESEESVGSCFYFQWKK